MKNVASFPKILCISGSVPVPDSLLLGFLDPNPITFFIFRTAPAYSSDYNGDKLIILSLNCGGAFLAENSEKPHGDSEIHTYISSLWSPVALICLMKNFFH